MFSHHFFSQKHFFSINNNRVSSNMQLRFCCCWFINCFRLLALSSIQKWTQKKSFVDLLHTAYTKYSFAFCRRSSSTWHLSSSPSLSMPNQREVSEHVRRSTADNKGVFLCYVRVRLLFVIDFVLAHFRVDYFSHYYAFSPLFLSVSFSLFSSPRPSLPFPSLLTPVSSVYVLLHKH